MELRKNNVIDVTDLSEGMKERIEIKLNSVEQGSCLSTICSAIVVMAYQHL